MLNKLTTNYTYFLREKDHFTFFRNTILPELEQRHRRDKVLSIWSAGCSSGEEPYTLSIYLKEYFGAPGRPVGHPGAGHRHLPAGHGQGPGGRLSAAGGHAPGVAAALLCPQQRQPRGNYAVAPDIRDNVIFRTFNLMDPIQFRAEI